MFIKASLLATLAALSLAAPAPSAEASALDTLESRATCTPNGAIIFYPQTNYGGASNATTIFAFQGQQAFCTQFQPTIKGSFGFKSYFAADIIMILYKNSNCAGNDPLVIAKANNNTQEGSVNDSGYLSFQAVYST